MSAPPPPVTEGTLLHLKRLLEDQFDVFGVIDANQAIPYQIKVLVDFLESSTRGCSQYECTSYFSAVVNGLLDARIITKSMKAAVGQKFLHGPSIQVAEVAAAKTVTRPNPFPGSLINNNNLPLFNNQQTQNQLTPAHLAQYIQGQSQFLQGLLGNGLLHPQVGYPPFVTAHSLTRVNSTLTNPGSTRVDSTSRGGRIPSRTSGTMSSQVRGSWIPIPHVDRVSEASVGRPDGPLIGELVRHFVLNSQEDNTIANTVNCRGDWRNLKVVTDAKGQTSTLFRCNCGGTAQVKAVLVGANWLLYSKPGGFHLSVAAERLILTAEHKAVIRQALTEDSSVGFLVVLNKVLEHFHDSLSHVPTNNRHFFDKQVKQHLKYLKKCKRLAGGTLGTLGNTLNFFALNNLNDCVSSPGFVATDSHQSPIDVQKALHLPTPSTPVFIPLIEEDFNIPEGCTYKFTDHQKTKTQS
jgi:hypothetical protein